MFGFIKKLTNLSSTCFSTTVRIIASFLERVDPLSAEVAGVAIVVAKGLLVATR